MKHVPRVATLVAAYLGASADVMARDAGGLLVDQIAQELSAFVAIVVGGALTAVAAYLVALVRDKLGDAAAERLRGALDRAVALGEAAVEDTTETAVGYLKGQLPDSIRRLRMTDARLHALVAADLRTRPASGAGSGAEQTP